MGYDTFILFFDTVSVVFLMALVLLLCAATRFKCESSYAALILFFIVLSDYIHNVCDALGRADIALLTAPLAYAANLTLMPFMFLLAHRGFNPNYRFRFPLLLHFLPALAYAVLVVIHIRMMSPMEQQHFAVERSADFRSLLTTVNFLTLSAQLILYFYLIFRYLRKVKQYVLANFSQAELTSKVWIPRFITLVGVLIVVAMLSSFFHPFGGFRLFYVVNVVAVGYLIYQELEHALAYRRKSADISPEKTSVVSDEEVNTFSKLSEPSSSNDDEQLKQYARQVSQYLETSEAYTNPNLSLNDVAKATGISVKNLSKSINSVLGKNFFDLVNGLRIEKSKDLLVQKKQLGLTLETIAEQCGFNSQFTFCRAFKKGMGVSTSEWLRMVK